MNAIQTEITIKQRWLDCQPTHAVKDYDGTMFYIDPSPEENAVYQRVQMLEELTQLRQPVGESWKTDMHFEWCCHPEQFPPADYDPMGEMMGRNE